MATAGQLLESGHNVSGKRAERERHVSLNLVRDLRMVQAEQAGFSPGV
jgi:hypothetical protein